MFYPENLNVSKDPTSVHSTISRPHTGLGISLAYVTQKVEREYNQFLAASDFVLSDSYVKNENLLAHTKSPAERRKGL